jgi:hypothetical protein
VTRLATACEITDWAVLEKAAAQLKRLASAGRRLTLTHDILYIATLDTDILKY